MFAEVPLSEHHCWREFYSGLSIWHNCLKHNTNFCCLLSDSPPSFTSAQYIVFLFHSMLYCIFHCCYSKSVREGRKLKWELDFSLSHARSLCYSRVTVRINKKPWPLHQEAGKWHDCASWRQVLLCRSSCMADLRLKELGSQSRWVYFDQGTQALCSRPAIRFTRPILSALCVGGRAQMC